MGFILGVSITLFLLISYAFRKNNNWEGGNFEKIRSIKKQIREHKRLKDLRDRGATDEEIEEIAFELARIEDELAHK